MNPGLALVALLAAGACTLPALEALDLKPDGDIADV